MEFIAGNAFQFSENGLTILADIDVGEGCVQGDGLGGIEFQRPCAAAMIDVVEGTGAVQGFDARVSVQGVGYAARASGGAFRGFEQSLGRFVERIRPIIAEDIPQHGPPCARSQQTRDFNEGRGFIEPMESCGADAEIETLFLQNHLIEGRHYDLQGSVGIRPAKIAGRSRVRFDGNQRACAKIQEGAGGFSGSRTDLEDGRSIGQAASFDQCREDPLGIRWPSNVVARRIGTEGAAAECAIDAGPGFAHTD